MRIRFLEIAEIELAEAVQYYNYESPGLGEEFLKEVIKRLDIIARFPTSWHPCSKRTRRCQTRRFPYGIIYQIRADEILVISECRRVRCPKPEPKGGRLPHAGKDDKFYKFLNYGYFHTTISH